MFIIEKTSWHYRFASMLSSYDARTTTNLCPYIRLVIKGMFWFTVMAALVIAFAIMNLLGIADAVNGLWLVDGKLSGFAFVNTVTIAAISGVGVVAVCMWLGDKYRDWQHERYLKMRNNQLDANYTKPQPSFLRVWWESFHGKYCIPVKVNSESDYY